MEDSIEILTDEAAQILTKGVLEIAESRIEQRLRDGQDIAKVYTAEIVNSKVSEIDLGTVTVNQVTSVNKNGKVMEKAVVYPVKQKQIVSAKFRYNEDDYITISNDSVRILTENDKYAKICTYDNVHFYILHRI